MSNNCLAGFPAFGPRVDTNITYHPKEIVFDPALELPTSAPETPQIQIPVSEGDLPSFSPFLIPYMAAAGGQDIYVPLLICSFYNSGASAATIYMQYNSSGTSYIQAGTGSIGAGKYKASTSTRTLTSWNVGSTLQFRCYASAAGVQLLRAYLVLIPRRIGGGLPAAANLYNVEIQTAAASLIGAASCTSMHNSSLMMVNIMYRCPNLGGGATFSGLSLQPGSYLNKIGAMTIPGTEDPNTRYFCGSKNMADQGGAILLWSSDSATENLYHLQPHYITRIAYTPIL